MAAKMIIASVSRKRFELFNGGTGANELMEFPSQPRQPGWALGSSMIPS
jgi:hypothetical protein